MTGTNFYEQRARNDKARRLARWMYGEMLVIARTADQEMWDNTARRAGCNSPSKETIADTIAILEGKAKDIVGTTE